MDPTGFRAQTGVLTGCEVLVRWEHPQRELSHRISLFLWRSHLVLSSNDSPVDETDCGYSDAGKTFVPDNFHIGINVSAGCFLAAGLKKSV